MLNFPEPARPALVAGWRSGVLGAALLLASLCGVAHAAQTSRSGQFVDDDEVASFAVQFSSAGLFSARTWSYGGGTNAAGYPIAAGGFAPVLTLADAQGEVLFSGSGAATDSVCSALAAAAPASGFCWDTGFSLMLAAGSYGLYLTQDGNLPAGSNVLTDGFSRSGRADYTAVENLGLAGSGLRFVQVDGTLRTGLWALDYTASAPLDIGQPVPEPSTALSLALGLLLLSAHLARRTPPH